MTKEELERDVKYYAKRTKSAESYIVRQNKRIAELEETINKLQVQNNWLEGCKLELAEHLGKTNDRVSELEQQIEKMKCCENCKHSDTECEGHTICSIGHYDDCLSNKVLYHTTDEKDYWELEENE